MIDLSELIKTITGTYDSFKQDFPSYMIETKNSAFTVVQSLSYGDMLISLLLLMILLTLVFYWIWRVI